VLYFLSLCNSFVYYCMIYIANSFAHIIQTYMLSLWKKKPFKLKSVNTWKTEFTSFTDTDWLRLRKGDNHLVHRKLSLIWWVIHQRRFSVGSRWQLEIVLIYHL
jgi:hypothetical protein